MSKPIEYTPNMKLRIVLLILITGLLFISCDKEDSFYFEGDWEVENPYIEIVYKANKPDDAYIYRNPGQITIKDGGVHYYYVYSPLHLIESSSPNVSRYEEERLVYDALVYKFRFEDPHIYFSDFNWYDLVSYSKDRMVWRELETGKEFILNRKKQ